MKESIVMFCQENGSDKEYRAELKQEVTTKDWVVNFAYGKKGASLKAGTKTKVPVKYDVAKKTYDKLIKSKEAKLYIAAGQSASINAVTDRVDSGVRPQLLNELTQEEAVKYILDDDYCMQEKFDGERRIVKTFIDKPSVGVNKKGIEIALSSELQEAADNLIPKKNYILDGEDMGGVLMCFDDLSVPDLSYKERYAGLPLGQLSLLPVKTAWTTETKTIMFNRMKRIRAEGVVFKNIHAPYQAGRPASGGDQLKCKFYESASCIVSSISNIKSSIGVHVFGSDNLPVAIGNATLYPNSPYLKVGDIVEIKYLYYNEGGSLYQPVLLARRNDVDPDECTLAKLKRKKN